MKTWTSSTWISGLALLLVFQPGGPARGQPEGSPSPAPATPATATPVSPNAVSPGQTPPKPRLSPWTTEIVKLAEAGVDEGAMQAFIDNAGTFNLDAEEIIYLNDQSVPSRIISAMLQHDSDVVSGLRALTITSQPPSEPLFSTQVTARGEDSTPAVQTAAVEPGASTSPAAEQPDLANLVPWPGVDVGSTKPVADGPQVAAASGSARSPAPGQPGQADERKPIVYPVREPYPVQLTAPIVFVQAGGRVPNVMVLDWFPEIGR